MSSPFFSYFLTLSCDFSQDGIDILNAQYYSRITMSELEKIVQPAENSSPLPLLNERLAVLHETGAILLKVIEAIL
jgi:hypothetical protein